MDIHLLHGKNRLLIYLLNIDSCFLFHSLAYVFVIGKGQKSWVSLPGGKGIRLTVAEERDRRLAGKTQ
jgi:hypothetical protein